MEILWLAIVFYSIGLGLVLHFRPSLMFHENGVWKEFGYQRDSESRHTLFPFWLFAIAWAFASYVLAAAITWSLSSPAALAFSTTAAAAASSSEVFGQYSLDKSEESEEEQEEEPEEAEELEVPVRRSRGRPRKTQSKPRPGYYVIAPESKEGGLRRYVYYGENPPDEANVQSVKINGPNRVNSSKGITPLTG
jgi:hypothetical protein